MEVGLSGRTAMMQSLHAVFHSAGDETQGLMYKRQIFYQLSFLFRPDSRMFNRGVSVQSRVLRKNQEYIPATEGTGHAALRLSEAQLLLGCATLQSHCISFNLSFFFCRMGTRSRSSQKFTAR